MILKKPYGFLIKHFRLIHFILFGLMILISYISKPMINFFADYVKNDYTATIFDNMVSTYIPWYVIASLILLLIIIASLYILLNHKKKPTKLYIIIFIYYTIYLIMTIVAHKLIGGLSENLWTTEASRAYKDIYQMYYIIQFICIIFVFIRTFGFDIKKFDFKKDLEELELNEKDSELVEVNFDMDTSKIKRLFRRFKREFIYYIKENTFIFIGILSIILIIIVYSIYKNADKLNYNYKENEPFYYNNLNYTILDSMITNLNTKGEKSSNKSYFVIKLKVKNVSNLNQKIPTENIKLENKGKKINPKLDIGSMFSDYAKPYENDIIKPEQEEIFEFAYEINPKTSGNFKLEIYYGESLKKIGKSKKINVNLNPKDITNINVLSNSKMGQKIEMNDTNIGNINLIIDDYYIGDSYYFDYEICDKEKCKKYKDAIIADFKTINSKTLLILKGKYEVDNKNNDYKLYNYFGNLFISINYKIGNKEYKSDIKALKAKNLKNAFAFQVDKEIENANCIDVLITIRNKRYIINIK